MPMGIEELKERAAAIRLIAVDMDGTVLNGSGITTEHTRRVLQNLSDSGYLIVPVTGRGYWGLREKVLGVDGIRYCIAGNGSSIYDGERDEVIYRRPIPKEIAARLCRELEKDGYCSYIHRGDPYSSHIMCCKSRMIYEKFFRKNNWPPSDQILTSGLDRYILEDSCEVMKIGLWFLDPGGFDELEPMAAARYPMLNAFRVDKRAMEFISKDAGKEIALRWLCENIGIDKSGVCAIGDNGNDIGMISWAGIGAAMANAIPSARESADIVIGSNDEDGAAMFLEQLFG